MTTAASQRAATVLGVGLLIVGVALHLVDFASTANDGFHMIDMQTSPGMVLGMALVGVGVLMAGYGLLWRPGPHVAAPKVRAIVRDGSLRLVHWRLAGVLGLALAIDVMKPFTIGFVLPGLSAEYGLASTQAALLPLVALTGTVTGSIVWGVLADWAGRRAAILFAALLFIATSICGAMPAFWLNLVMCFFMGASAGGLLPIAFALLAEVIPTKHRGWMCVSVGAIGSVGGYLAASVAALVLEPFFGWRALWLIGFPTGLLLIMLQRHLPESPRFLLARGYRERAERSLEQFGASLAVDLSDAPAPPTMLFSRASLPITTALLCYGVAWGIANFGFLTWLPTTLRGLGLPPADANKLLATAALLAAPIIPLIAWLYARWSTKRSIALLGLLVATALVFLAIAGDSLRQPTATTIALFALLFAALAGASAMLLPYSAEVYRTEYRGTGVGLIAASTKCGGVIGPAVVAVIVSTVPGIVGPAIATAAPLAIAGLILARIGAETRGRPIR
jgi:MFS transporter, putative metabolite:H+ symporter